MPAPPFWFTMAITFTAHLQSGSSRLPESRRSEVPKSVSSELRTNRSAEDPKTENPGRSTLRLLILFCLFLFLPVNRANFWPPVLQVFGPLRGLEIGPLRGPISCPLLIQWSKHCHIRRAPSEWPCAVYHQLVLRPSTVSPSSDAHDCACNDEFTDSALDGSKRRLRPVIRSEKSESNC